MNFIVIKRDGRKEPFSLQKIEKIINFVIEGLDIDINKFLNHFQFTFKNEITTKEIQQNLINTANLLTYDDNTINKDFSIMANRLYLFDFWKEFKLNRENEYNTLTDEFGFFKNSAHWINHLENYIDKGVYNERILTVSKDILRKLYTAVKRLNATFDNFTFPHFMWNNYYYQTLKFRKSYLIKYNNKEIENFEEALLLISIMGFLEDYKVDKDLFMNNVLEFYKHLINYHFIPATPQLLNLRRKNGNLSSCNILNVYDNLESILYSINQAGRISKEGGGIGIDVSNIRPSGSWFKGNKGYANHISIWLRIFNDLAVAVNQGGLRKGAITFAIPIWHLDVFEAIQCRNPLGEQRYKLFDLFPQIKIPDVFIKRLKENKPWYLLDIYEIRTKYPELDLNELSGEQLTKAYEKIVQLIEEGKIEHYKKVEPITLLSTIFKSITNSGLPYIMYEDNVNNNSPFKEKIYSLNLCVESFSPFKNTNPEGKQFHELTDDDIGYIHSCNLFSLNLPKIYEDGILFDDAKLKQLMKLAVRYMDNIISESIAPVPEIRKHNRLYRTIGIGYIGFADLIVKLSVDTNTLYTYRFTSRAAGDEQLKQEYKNRMFDLISKVFGRVAFYTMYASIELAKTRGTFEKYEYTKWKDGILLGRYNTNELSIDELSKIFSINNKDEIKELINNLKEYGIRNSMLLNCPPNTSTAIYAGSSPSILPVYSLFSKEDQKNASYFTFPRYINYPLYYDIYQNYNFDDMSDIIDIVSKIQQYIDSGISFEYPINSNIISKKELPKYLLHIFTKSHEKGIKALYYGRIVTTQGKEDCAACAN